MHMHYFRFPKPNFKNDFENSDEQIALNHP